MKQIKKIIIIIAIALIIITGSIIGIRYYLNSNNLTVSEKNWLDEAKTSSKVLNINIINNAEVFSQNGNGVFQNFLDDFAAEYDLNINKVTFNYGTNPSGITLNAVIKTDDNDNILYTDHYVYISKNSEIITSSSDLSNKNIAVLSSDLSYISSFINQSNITYTSYETIGEIVTAINDGANGAIIPLHLYLNTILTNNYHINYHFSDINMYYVLSTEDDELSSIIRKFYNTWEENIEEYYYDNLFNSVTTALNISDTEIDALRSVTYKYGFLNNSPYEIISSGNYGGIAAVYLKNFMNFADVEFNFVKYRNIHKFIKALNKDEIDVFFTYYDVENEFNTTDNGINSKYYVIANSKNNIVVNSLSSLNGKEVYIDKYSMLNTYITKLNSNIKINTYDSYKELLKLNKKDAIIIIDSNIFEYYKSHGLDNYTVRYSNTINYNYGFNVKTDSALYKLLNSFVSISDPNIISNEGIYNHEQTIASGRILSLIAKYFIYVVIISLIVLYFIIRKTKKIKIAKKIKKDDKLKFIDQLTLLKNRNYLHENINEWSKNTIYPQAVIVIDLNHLHDINDTQGYEEGDKQIKAAANMIIKYQLDNTDIIRSDGNEFIIYLVGYSQKQITNYIHKLNREFKKLPYNYGAEFGYSMIIDDIKTIEDALNEATNSLKEQKELNEEKN